MGLLFVTIAFMVHFDGGSSFYNGRGLPENLLTGLHLNRFRLCFLSFKMLLILLLMFGIFPSFIQFSFFFKNPEGSRCLFPLPFPMRLLCNNSWVCSNKPLLSISSLRYP